MLLIAHRGASAYAPENTLAAFRLALEMGARALEFDVHQTRDHELVVIHDADLRRVAGRKARVADLTWKELSAVDVGSWRDAAFAAERVPRLGDVFDLAGGRVELHVELKAGSAVYPGIEERVVDFIQARRAWQRCVVSSFDHAALYAARSLDERLRLGYLLGLTGLRTAWREIGELKAESLNISLRQADRHRVREARNRGCKVLVYTVNTRKDLARLDKMGVDGVFTNHPDLSL